MKGSKCVVDAVSGLCTHFIILTRLIPRLVAVTIRPYKLALPLSPHPFPGVVCCPSFPLVGSSTHLQARSPFIFSRLCECAARLVWAAFCILEVRQIVECCISAFVCYIGV